ncbi:MAG: amidohydrolase [Chloroflexi bacterium]|nr:amidohydrolase [Chloroflexota bacterium]
MDYRVISSDSHVAEPELFYRERVPAEYRHRTPHIEERDGGQYRVVEGRKPRRLDLAEAQLTDEDMEREWRKGGSGGTDIQYRISDQERDGVSAEVVYPDYTLWLFSSPDPQYQLAVAKAYNDWAIELFGPYAERFAPAAVIPVADIPAAVGEIERVSRLGYRIINIPAVMSKRPYNRPEYEPLWTAIEDSGVVLSLHARAVDYDPFPEGIGEEEMGGFLKWIVLGMAESQDPVTILIAAGVLQRHPRIQFTIAESGAGWLGWLLYTLDEHVVKKHMWVRPKLDMMPSEFFKRQGHLTFGDDPAALNNLSLTGSDCLLWGSDYPHDEGTFPHSQEVISRTFKDVSEEDTRKIVGENAAKLYGFPLN